MSEGEKTSEQEQVHQQDAHNAGVQPLQKGFVPTEPGKTIAQDGFTPAAPEGPATPPQTVPNMTTSVQPPPKKEG